MIANRADNPQVGGGGIYQNGEAIATFFPKTASEEAVVVANLTFPLDWLESPTLFEMAASGHTVAVGTQQQGPGGKSTAGAGDDLLLQGVQGQLHEEPAHRVKRALRQIGVKGTQSTFTRLDDTSFPCTTTATANYPLNCAAISAEQLAAGVTLSSDSGNISCAALGQVSLQTVPSNVSLLLTVQEAYEKFNGTPSVLPLRSCALMLCALSSSSPNASAAPRQCQASWAPPMAGETGTSLGMLQSVPDPFRVLTMMTANEVGSRRPVCFGWQS